MNRRGFLKVVGYTAAGAMIPLKLVTAGSAARAKEKGLTTLIKVTTDEEELYFQVATEIERTEDKVTYFSLERIVITPERSFIFEKLEAELPKEMQSLLDRRWSNIPIPGGEHGQPYTIVQANTDLTIQFNKEGIYKITS